MDQREWIAVYRKPAVFFFVISCKYRQTKYRLLPIRCECMLKKIRKSHLYGTGRYAGRGSNCSEGKLEKMMGRKKSA